MPEIAAQPQTNSQLITKLATLRQRLAKREALEAERRRAEALQSGLVVARVSTY
jgi:hypothetical protein